MNNYDKDFAIYRQIVERYRRLSSTDPSEAFRLSKDSLILFDRFSEIRKEYRQASGREGAAMKERFKDMCEFLEEVSTHSRMIWKYCVEGERRADI